ncbi:hypothetical protein VN97_g12435, partial [Penicillium thymicola]
MNLTGRSSRDAELPRGDSQSMFLTNLHGYLHGQIPFFFLLLLPRGDLLPTLFDEANMQTK